MAGDEKGEEKRIEDVGEKEVEESEGEEEVVKEV